MANAQIAVLVALSISVVSSSNNTEFSIPTFLANY